MSPRDKTPRPSSPGLPDQTAPTLVRETATPVHPPTIPSKPRDAASRYQERVGPGQRLISLQEAAVVLGVSVASARRLIWTRKLPAVRLTRRLQIDIRDLDRLIEQSKNR
jgi:excisionase family DNA binding protein